MYRSLRTGNNAGAIELSTTAWGGAQLYAERLAASHLQHGSVAHPTREDRPNIRDGIGSAAFAVNGSAEVSVPFTHFFEESVRIKNDCVNAIAI